MQKSIIFRFRSRNFTSFVNPRSYAPTSFVGKQFQFTRGFYTTPFVWCDNNNNTPIRVNDSVDAIENDLSKLLVASTEENDVVSAIEAFQLKKDMLATHGLTLVEEDQFITLKGSKEGRSFALKWDSSENPNSEFDGEDYQDENDAESDNEDPDIEEDEMEEEQDYDDDKPTNIAVNLSIEKEGGNKIYLHCGVDADGQFLVYRMGSSNENMVIISELSEDIQHRVYDYLEELGIGDGTGDFILSYNTNALNSRELDTMKYVGEFFSK